MEGAPTDIKNLPKRLEGESTSRNEGNQKSAHDTFIWYRARLPLKSILSLLILLSVVIFFYSEKIALTTIKVQK